MERRLAMAERRQDEQAYCWALCDAFNEGGQAAKYGEGLASNPYKVGPMSDSFVDGYWDFKETRI